LPGWSYLTGRVIHAMFVGVILVILTLAFGKIFYQGTFPTGLPLLEFIVTFIVGSLSFAALALATTAVVPNADAAPPIVNAIVLPLLFLSGIFIPLGDNAPSWIKVVGAIFPVKHFAEAMRAGYLGNVVMHTPIGVVHPFSFDWTDIWVIGAWGIGGLILASVFFSWEPRK
jgi:ABC-2 type transport system permease protein